MQPEVAVPFVCNIARGSDVEPSHPYLYGHGLLGDRGEANGGSTEDLRLRGFSPCAVDWWGMSTADLANVALILADMSNFPSLADRSQQGFLNFMFLGRAMAHPDGFSSDPAFQRADGTPLLRTGELRYVGNSQGGIMGGALTALSPDVTRSVLGVPAMNYSTLLNRSVDWEGSYAAIAYQTYPGKIDQQLLFGLIQMLWDRAEGNGYAHHMTADPLGGHAGAPGAAAGRVLRPPGGERRRRGRGAHDRRVRPRPGAARGAALVRRPDLRSPAGARRCDARRVRTSSTGGAPTAGSRPRRTATCRRRPATIPTRTRAATTPARTSSATSC